MNDHVEAGITFNQVEPYLSLARQGVSALVRDGDSPENAVFIRRMQTFAATCMLQSGPQTSTKEIAPPVNTGSSFSETVRRAMQTLSPEVFPQEKRTKVEEMLKKLVEKTNWTGSELYILLFGLTGNTAIGELEQAVIDILQKNKELKPLLAMISF